jgi:hypothetical protein
VSIAGVRYSWVSWIFRAAFVQWDKRAVGWFDMTSNQGLGCLFSRAKHSGIPRSKARFVMIVSVSSLKRARDKGHDSPFGRVSLW